MIKYIITYILISSTISLLGQNSDTIALQEIIITTFYNDRPEISMPSSLVVANSVYLEYHRGSSSPVMLLSGLPGIRMEERSPGSYRIAVRGSTIRSPFGIRNIKVYLNEFPFTDAGGNTYLNLIDLNLVNRVDILKGPDGSLFGANSGGVVMLNTEPQELDSISFKLRISGGSFDTYNQSLQTSIPLSKHLISLAQSLSTTHGYRNHSSFKRGNFILLDKWTFSTKSIIKILFNYSNLMYDTPGGLTLEQWEKDPQLARPPTAIFPGMEEQKAGVNNSSFYAGIAHERLITTSLTHSILFFGSITDFENRFITNVEKRNESNFGLRTLLDLRKKHKNFYFRYITGTEIQNSLHLVSNYGNKLGMIDTLQSADDLQAIQTFIFTRVSGTYNNRLTAEISIGLNLNRYKINGNNTFFKPTHDFKPQLMPKLEISYLLKSNLSVRTSIGRGYSLPSFAEIRPSGNILNASLLPEHGYNFETGLRIFSKNNRLWLDFALYKYNLKDAIVRVTNDAGTEHFSNSGSIKQLGFESLINYAFIQNKTYGIVQSGKLILSNTISHFRFDNYISDSSSFQGNQVAGVPKSSLSFDIILGFINNIYLISRFNSISRIPLNNANSQWSENCNIFYSKIAYKFKIRTVTFDSYIALDNILNSKYSLGYDINAFGDRFYNAAPLRSVQIGLIIDF